MMTPVSREDPYGKSSTDSHDPYEIPREDFEEYDRDRDGMLSQKEFHRAMLRRYGYSVLGFSELIMNTFDSKKDGKIDFEEFLGFYAADRKADVETKDDLNKWADSIVCFGCSCFLCTAGLSCLPLYFLTRENYDTFCDPHYSVYFIKGPEARCETLLSNIRGEEKPRVLPIRWLVCSYFASRLRPIIFAIRSWANDY
eukprot:CAMPEP_0185268250 /NCGR_PEP_ID=MMETSP1359-20130426/36579_1 /TAXON_ID=552665 /ORGANISM="Bigelowiella longifila, Strain CCMP242" /LENGTH=197 /DNA_ID=CAMNT_0027858937 /DNA_START=21 /DNA_END=617 /DNA_ORIENTATION=+